MIKLAILHYQFEAIETTAFETQQRVSGIMTAMDEAMDLVKAKAPIDGADRMLKNFI